MKKLLLALSCTMVAGFALSSCGNSSNSTKIKVGLITLHDENSTYDKNFIDAFKAACEAKGVEAVIRTDVPEANAAYEAAADLADDGCKFVFADSFGHETHIIQAAREYKDVQFLHATGTYAHTENLDNFHNAFASIYEGRYLAGVAAGLKLASMEGASHKIGYVGAHPYAEVISGYTSFYLGVKSIVSDVTMDVKFTNSWYDESGEKNAALSLIASGCSLISQHADSWGAPTACEDSNVPNVSYNGSTSEKCPNTYLVSSKINWQPYFEYAIDAVKNGTKIEDDYVGTLGDSIYEGSVCLTELGKNVVEGTENKLKEVAKELKDGTRKVFDCSTFTVNNEKVTSYSADVNSDPNFTGDTEVIKTENGITYFAESEFRSAPYFDLKIDGINILSEESK